MAFSTRPKPGMSFSGKRRNLRHQNKFAPSHRMNPIVHCRFVLYAIVTCLLPSSVSAEEWRNLFNGRDLEGWSQIGSAKWRVEEGVIVGGQDGEPRRSGLLATTDQFKNFELELEFMIDEH